jgi:hypothetical protein
MATKSKTANKKKPSASVKTINKSHKQIRVNKRTHKRHNNHHLLFLAIIISITIFAIIYMYRSVDLANIYNESSARDAAGMLAYDKTQIKTAKTVGSDAKLRGEIVNYSWAPNDLKQYVLKDYKEFKNNCVVNGNLVGHVSYKITSVEYDKFATIIRGCNGEQKSILVKFSGKWANVYSGNTLIGCNIINDFSIPRIVSPNCETNNVIYINPNP